MMAKANLLENLHVENNHMTQNPASYLFLWATTVFICMKEMLDMCFPCEIYSETQRSQDRSTKYKCFPTLARKKKVTQ